MHNVNTVYEDERLFRRFDDAVISNDLETVKSIFPYKDVNMYLYSGERNSTGRVGITPLFHVINSSRYSNETKILEYLLTIKDIDVNKGDKLTGETPLCAAVGRDRADFVRLLLDAPGIDVNKADRKGNPLSVHGHFLANRSV